MPNYEYQCTACAHKFELCQSVGEAAPACPECDAEVKKVFHVPRVIFKGSGFYVTDLRAEKEGAKSKSKANGGDKADSSNAGSETKTETAAATTPAPTTSAASSGDSK